MRMRLGPAPVSSVGVNSYMRCSDNPTAAGMV